MPDRLAALLGSSLNGIDFVEIASPDQTRLVVHFLTTTAVAGSLTGPVTITGGASVPTVAVSPIAATDWSTDDAGHPLLALTAAGAGDFSFYLLSIPSPVLDVYYSSVRFTFKAGCPSALDCAPPTAPCPEDTGGPAIDYLAKDFASFRRALLDYSASAYPGWVERDEPDIAMMLVELLSAVGDDLSYTQDRVAAEATLATATQRRSVLRHARLVDYEPRPATSAQVLLQLDVTTPTPPVRVVALAPLPDGTTLTFETGRLLDADTAQVDTTAPLVDPRWNRLDHTATPPSPRIAPHIWDDSQRCLPAGSTEMWVVNHGFGFGDHLADPNRGTPGLALLIDTAAAAPIDAPIREIVHLTGADESIVDDVLKVPVTRLTWDASEALTADHDLTRTTLAGNLVAAYEGRLRSESFDIDPATDLDHAAVTRTGPDAGCCDSAPIYLHTLSQGRLAWLPGADDQPVPELVVMQTGGGLSDRPHPWRWRRRLLDAALFEQAYTVDPLRYSDIRAANQPLGPALWEYDGDDADSIRFGDGVCGDRPAGGTSFQITYRTTSGAAGNVAADTIVGVDSGVADAVTAVTNPFAAAGGADEETLDDVRAAAPYAFRASQFRAVRAADYTLAAEELPWVLDAGTTFRWTGSWKTVFTTAQPRGREDIPIDDHTALIELLDRRRLAGYEVYTPNPRYVSLDLVVTVCADAGALRGEVFAAVATALSTGIRPDGRPAFFARDQFRFGQPLERSALECAVQNAPGVDGVISITYRRRGYLADFVALPETVVVARDEIIRVDNDPSWPDRGSVRIVVEGGK